MCFHSPEMECNTLNFNVSIYSDTNLMTTTNLSLVFGPILAWSDDAQMNTLVNITLINTFTEILIARYTELFLK
ncbi:unnamed protein product [Adineta steineri]|uniref:Rho-GAP domain-containing protein n=1 Tax=Adineta steineri TaxID=433720 RepID=A0A815CIE4_9BILA|nr:unnamed protein product [Adineta steineri]CAF4321165.1 unnamed protein product [Adineta steineri]